MNTTDHIIRLRHLLIRASEGKVPVTLVSTECHALYKVEGWMIDVFFDTVLLKSEDWDYIDHAINPEGEVVDWPEYADFIDEEDAEQAFYEIQGVFTHRAIPNHEQRLKYWYCKEE
jgi:hypothetical protein